MVPYCIDFSKPTMSLLSTGFLINKWRLSSFFNKSINGWYKNSRNSFFRCYSGFLQVVLSTWGSYLPKITNENTQNVEVIIPRAEQCKEDAKSLSTLNNLWNQCQQFLLKALDNQHSIISVHNELKNSYIGDIVSLDNLIKMSLVLLDDIFLIFWWAVVEQLDEQPDSLLVIDNWCAVGCE